MQPRLLCEAADGSWRITANASDWPELTHIRVVGAPDWQAIVEAATRYNVGRPGRLTLWDLRAGHLPAVRGLEAATGMQAIADDYARIEGRRTALLADRDADFGTARMVQAYGESTLETRALFGAIRSFRQFESAIHWLLETAT
jgi:hypothetical protein